MSANPVLRALERAKRDAQVMAWEHREAELEIAVVRLLGVDCPGPKTGIDDDDAIKTFRAWCELNGVRSLPAQPATLAQFALEHATRGIEKLAEAVAAISELHFVQGLPDPAATWMVAAALQRVGDVPPPRSWPKDLKAQFSQLPRTVKKYVADHDVRREKVLRRAQNEAARARRSLAADQATARRDGDARETAMEKPSLSEKIVALRAEAEAFLDARAAELAKESPGVPVGVLRNLIAARAPGCRCLQVLGETKVE